MKTSFFNVEELKALGLKSFGSNVLISRNAQLYNPEKLTLGSHVRIDDFCILTGKITLGSYIHISAYCALYGKGGIIIKDFSGLSPRCTLFSVTDNFNGNYLMSPLTYLEHNDLIEGEIIINKYVQIGANSTILPNCVLEEGTAVGAMSLVKDNLESWSIYAGVPVKKIKERNQGLLKHVKDYKL